MTLSSSLVAANAAAAAAASGKKAAQVQLQAELNSDDDWTKFLKRDGLLVVDVYTEWCGPCLGMVGNLKKIKLELGGDNLHLAVAKSDYIECLKRFRNKSEPTWMFIAGGQLINVIFGADAPRLARSIETELKNEQLVRQGQLQRTKRAPHELTPQEQEEQNIKDRWLEEKKAREIASIEEARFRRREARAKRLEVHYADVCPALLMPHAQKNVRRVADALEHCGVVIADKCPLLISKEVLQVIGAEDPTFKDPTVAPAVAERPALTLMIKKQPDKEGCVIELCRRAIFGEGLTEEEMPRKTIAQEFMADAVPGIFVPADRHQRAVALDLLFPKMISTLIEPPTLTEPPHIAMVFGAWQRKVILAVAATPPVVSRVLRYGFFADTNVEQPKLLAKNLQKYDERPEKDYCETIVLMVSIGLADPALADASTPILQDPPLELMTLGPLHVSQDCVIGAEECARFFPPGYSEPEHKPKPKSKKKKKKRPESKDGTIDATCDAPPVESPEGETLHDGENDLEPPGDHENGDIENGDIENGDIENGDVENEEGDEEVEDGGLDKATSPPPQTPH